MYGTNLSRRKHTIEVESFSIEYNSNIAAASSLPVYNKSSLNIFNSVDNSIALEDDKRTYTNIQI